MRLRISLLQLLSDVTSTTTLYRARFLQLAASRYLVFDVFTFNPTFSASRFNLVYFSATTWNVLPTMSTSSAKQMNWLDLLKIVPRMLKPARFITPSSEMLNRRQERSSPCRSPLHVSNETDNAPDIFTQHCTPSIVALISLVSFPGKPFSSIIFHSSSRSTVS